MFESNFPVDKGSYAYAPYWNACKILARGASAAEKTDLFSGTAARFYRLGDLSMRTLKIGDVTITSIIERDGPWRQPEDMFPAYDPDLGRRYLAEMDPEVYDPASNRMVITYQTFVVRTPHHTILVDTCTGEDKGYPGADGFPEAALAGRLQRRGAEVRRHRLRVLHASAHRPLRLEHGAAQRALGADLPEGEIHLPQARIRRVGGSDRRAATSRPAMSGASTASRSSRRARRCWSTTTIHLTIRCG